MNGVSHRRFWPDFIVPPLIQCQPFALRVDAPSGLPLEKYLARRLERTPSEIRLWVRQGRIQQWQEASAAAQPLRFKQPPPCPARLLFDPPTLEPPTAMAEDLPLERVYEDDYLVVVNKPSGMATHPSSGWWRGSCVSALLYQIRDWPGIKGVAGPGIVHRLDKNTSGLLLFAKTHLAQQGLLRALKHREIEREYVAATARWDFSTPPDLDISEPLSVQGTWRWPLGRDPQHNLKECVRPDGKRAVTHYKHLQQDPSGLFSLVALKLETGRTHQIRVHLQQAGYPILRDGLYGTLAATAWNYPMALHAYRLRLIHPITQAPLSFYREPSFLAAFTPQNDAAELPAFADCVPRKS